MESSGARAQWVTGYMLVWVATNNARVEIAGVVSRSSLSVLISRSPHCSPNNIVSLIDLTGPIAHLLFAEPPKMFVGHRARTRDYSVYLRSMLGQCGRLNQSSPKGNHPVA